MRPEKSKRVEINPQQRGLAGLQNALTNVNLPSLAAADEPPNPVTPPMPGKRGRVILRRETAHRGGRTVIVIHDFPPNVTGSALEDLARGLRRALGTGGTVRNRTIEMQGDQPGKIRAFLKETGFQVAGV